MQAMDRVAPELNSNRGAKFRSSTAWWGGQIGCVCVPARSDHGVNSSKSSPRRGSKLMKH